VKDAPITDITTQGRFLGPEDSLGKVVSILRAAQARALSVTHNGRVVGLVTEAAVLARLAKGTSDEATVAEVMERDPPCANVYMTVEQAADLMNASGAEALPVIDEFGSYRGIVARGDVLAAMLDVLRPPVVAGMATPLGVHLTTGAVSAGAGSLGLYLSGVALMLMMIAARGVLVLAAFLSDRLFGTHLIALLASPPTGALGGVDTIHTLFIPLQLILMLLFLRLSPISSYHAAEHQVVHTIESGEPLAPEIVARMPRAHPRCGTNLMAAAAIFILIASRLGSTIGVLIGIVVVVLGWRTIGYYLQQYVTTRRPGQRHIQNGIEVGEELLAKYRRAPNKSADGWMRIRNMGILQVAFGLATVLMLDSWLSKYFEFMAWF